MEFSLRRIRLCAATLVLAAAGAQAACTPEAPSDLTARTTSADFARNESPGTHLQYGVPVKLGEGKVRTYVVLDEKSGRTPIEIGVAIDARTMEGALPNDGRRMIPLALPQHAPEPYRFVLFDWNPQGHMPPGVYDVPHFDFHFYWMPQDAVWAITPEDPQFAAKANHLPTGEFAPPFHIVPAPPGVEPAALAAPMMGLHLEDRRDPQLQELLGNPDAFQPFTKTFIYGSWDGRLIFAEPMITREYLLRRTNETIAIPQPKRYPQPGWYPGAYRIAYDAQAKEYRVAIIDFAWHE